MKMTAEQKRHRDIIYGGSQLRYERACERAARVESQAQYLDTLDTETEPMSFNGLVTFNR